MENERLQIGYLQVFKSLEITDSFTLRSLSDRTKAVTFDLSGITSGQTRSLTIPNKSGTIALLDDISGGIAGSTGSTDNAILRADGTGGGTLQDSALVIDDATTSTQNNVAILNNHSETDSSLVLTPKGNGALILGPKPDGTSTGGIARGNRAIDIQSSRSASDDVASGADSVTIGSANKSSGQYASAIGRANNATGSWGIAIGGGNTASGLASFAAGYVNVASVRQAVALGGSANANRALIAYCGHSNSALGHRQALFGLLTQKTTDATPKEMVCDEYLNGRLTVQGGKVISGIVTVCGSKSDGSSAVLFSRDFLVKNVSGTTTLLSSNTIGTDFVDGTTAACSVLANDTNDSVAVTVTGIAGETWRWTAVFHASEHYYGT